MAYIRNTQIYVHTYVLLVWLNSFSHDKNKFACWHDSFSFWLLEFYYKTRFSFVGGSSRETSLTAQLEDAVKPTTSHSFYTYTRKGSHQWEGNMAQGTKLKKARGKFTAKRKQRMVQKLKKKPKVGRRRIPRKRIDQKQRNYEVRVRHYESDQAWTYVWLRWLVLTLSL